MKSREERLDMAPSPSVPVLLVFADPVLHPPVQPYGLSILAGGLHRAGIESQIECPFFYEEPAEALRKSCVRHKPTIVAFSFRNMDNAGFHHTEDSDDTYLDALVELVSVAKSSGAIVVVGGSGFSIAPTEVLKLVGADCGFVGPSESEFTEFCVRAIQHHKSGEALYEGLNSIVRRAGSPSKPTVQPLGTSSEFHSPTLEFARITGGTIPVRTKVGCSLTCAYCVVPSIEFSAYRPWQDVLRELKVIADAGLSDRVFIADGEFNLPSVEHAITVCKEIAREFGNSIKWRCYLEAGFINEGLLTSMAEAGCVGISLTVDSFSKETRLGMIKRTLPEVVIQATEDCLASGIHTQINLLFGGPNETLETAEYTASKAVEFNRRGVSVAVTIGLRVYPNTPLALMVRRQKYSRFYTASNRFNWLGMFCSPVPRAQLTSIVQRILVPSDTIVYTQSLSGGERKFYEKIAIGSTCLVEGQYKEATDHFRSGDSEQIRPEVRLGLLKAKLAAMESSEDKGN